ncbi:DUF928 domain-containing protein [Aliinostoc sp. HNIBRCY26]|uniref:DUF928 domain-containing protein n=1 Tax=Aliinostoc sp. HNIBRCY26 TaxID=3418997 RepID=UPI003D0730CD
MMTNNKKSRYAIGYTRIFTGCILSAILGVTQAAMAGYKPPKDQKPPSGYSDSSGVRGRCESSSGRSLMLLAPQTHVGLTTSTHPTFAWYVTNNQSLPIKFSLYEFDTNLRPQKLDTYTKILLSSPGLMKQTLPQDLPGLSVGKRYLWQLQIICNPERPSHNPIARAEVEVVAAPQTLINDLAMTNNPDLKANLYGKHGIWYDAIKEALPANYQDKVAQVFTNLLASLTELEAAGKHRNFHQIALIYQE